MIKFIDLNRKLLGQHQLMDSEPLLQTGDLVVIDEDPYVVTAREIVLSESMCVKEVTFKIRPVNYRL